MTTSTPPHTTLADSILHTLENTLKTTLTGPEGGTGSEGGSGSDGSPLHPRHLSRTIAIIIHTLFTEAHLAGISAAGILATISNTIDAAYLCHHLNQHQDPDTPDPLPVSKDLRTKTGLPTRKGTDLHRAFSAAQASPELAALFFSEHVTPDQLAIVESIRINNLVDDIATDQQSQLLQSFYARCATELHELNTIAEDHNSPITPTHVTKVITAISDHPEFNTIRKDKDSRRTIWSAAGGKGCTLSISGPKSLINQIADKAQAVAPAFIDVLDDTGQSFIDHINTDGIDGMPGDAKRNKSSDAAPAEAPSATATTSSATTSSPGKHSPGKHSPGKHSPKVWNQLTGIALVKALLIGLEHMTGALQVAVRHRTHEVVTRAMGQAGEYRVILDTATGSLLRGTELERILGIPLVTKDLSGAWIVTAQAAAQLAKLGTNISLTFVDSTRPPSVPQYQPPASLSKWVIDHCGGCMYPGCDRTTGLELDHLIPYHNNYALTHCQTGPENLHSLCTEHHRLRTKGTVQCWTDDGGRSTTWRLDDGTTANVPAHGILADHTPSAARPPLPHTMTPQDVAAHVAAVAAEYLNTHPNTTRTDVPAPAPPSTVTPETLPFDMFDMPGEANPGMASADATPPF